MDLVEAHCQGLEKKGLLPKGEVDVMGGTR